MPSVPKFPPYDDPVWDGFCRRDIPDAERARVWAEIEEQDPGARQRLATALGRILAAILLSAARQLQAANREREDQRREATPSPSPKPKRTRRAKPSAIAAWEAQWQAEHAGEAES